MYNQTRNDLQKRWKIGKALVENISPEKLPRIDISGGNKRATYRYRLEDIEAYELRFLQGKP